MSKSNDLKITLDSKLITDIKQIELIKTEIKNFKAKELKLKLLFRASRNDDKKYHDLCDRISPTINIIN